MQDHQEWSTQALTEYSCEDFPPIQNHSTPPFTEAKTKVVLFHEIDSVKILLSLTHLHSRMCIRIYIFCSKKNTHKKQAKENKEEKKTKKKPKKGEKT